MSSHEVAKSTSVTLHGPDPEEPEDTRWSVIGDLRAPFTDMSDDANYECRDALYPMEGVEFDCETSCFYAYCVTEGHAMGLIHAIEGFLMEWRAKHPEWERNANRGFN